MTTTASVTYNTKSLIKQLEATRDRMKKEIAEWETANAKLPAKQKAWEKKARAWFKKNAASLIDDECSLYINSHSNRAQINVYGNIADLYAEIGKSPEEDRGQRPQYDQQRYDQKVAPLDEVENAIAMFKGCSDVEIKVSMRSTFFKYLR
jgi:hypothetical protein